MLELLPRTAELLLRVLEPLRTAELLLLVVLDEVPRTAELPLRVLEPLRTAELLLLAVLDELLRTAELPLRLPPLVRIAELLVRFTALLPFILPVAERVEFAAEIALDPRLPVDKLILLETALRLTLPATAVARRSRSFMLLIPLAPPPRRPVLKLPS